MPDLYATLGVSRDASKAAIRKGYRNAAKRAHPDGGGSAEAFRRLRTALLVLSDDDRRARYDETGKFEDDPPVDIKTAQALEALSYALDIALANVSRLNGDPRSTDMIAETKKVIGELRRKLDQEIAQYEGARDKWRRLEGRFSSKDKAVPSRIDALIRGKLAQLEMIAAQTKKRHEAMKDAEEVLSGETYRRDEPMKPTQGPMTVTLAQLMGGGLR